MFDVNFYKKQVKAWMQNHPDAPLEDFVDYCEELIPPSQFASYGWLLEQSSSWYSYILNQRDIADHLLRDDT